jgi:hypothetical protein
MRGITGRNWDGWLSLSLAGAVGATLADSWLMERRFGVFRGGFLAPEHLETWAQRLAFLLISGLSDLVVVGLIAAVVLWIGNRCGLATVPRRFLAFVAAVTPLALADLFSYQLFAYLGGAFDLSLMWDLVGRQPREFLAVSAAHLAEPLWLILLLGGTVAIAVWMLQKAFPAGERRVRGRGPAIAMVTVMVIVGTAAVSAAATLDAAMEIGLRRKPSAQAIAIVVNTLTDVDRDGYGIGSRPPDAKLFDAAVHPYAVDVPGNGIDEDGIGGDLPADWPAYTEGPSTPPHFAWRPDVVLVLLESVRADSLDAVVNGHAATPVLNALAREGASAPLAYSHNGFTYQSRHHLFSGSIAGLRGGTTLIDDFKANGYSVGYFSGQDDSFGGPELQVDFDRADAFFDARSAPERRYTEFSTPGSLAVPAGVVLEKAAGFVGSVDPATPMFLYVNFHDTHFPYHYKGIKPLVSDVVVQPGEIAPGRAGDLRDMYMNTVANVDAAIGTLLADVTRARGRAPAVIVTSDHGESLFDGGFLGHGYALNDAQTRVPFVAARLPLVLRQPFAQAAVRDAIWDALARVPEGTPRPDFTQPATTPSFQYLGDVNVPREIGFVGRTGRTLYDFREGSVQLPGSSWERADRLKPDGTRAYLGLVRFWESMMVTRAKGRLGTRAIVN